MRFRIGRRRVVAAGQLLSGGVKLCAPAKISYLRISSRDATGW